MVMREKTSDGSTVLTGAVLTLQDVVDFLYPVGKLYFTTEIVSPAGRFGGTWVAWGSGRVPVGVDISQAEFDMIEETGGAKTVALTAAQNGPHTHLQNLGGGLTNTNAVAGAGVIGTANTSTTGSSGNGDPHNNLQPYITCYMWKRTA